MSAVPMERRWVARPRSANVLHVLIRLVPIAAAAAAVYAAALLIRPPLGPFWQYLGWWIGLAAGGTVVLMLVGYLARRLLPLATLLRLSLVFPDQTPSRFATAVKSGAITSLEERIADVKRFDRKAPPADAARRLLGLVAELDRHDRLTRGHSERVRVYARMIGSELGLGTRDLDRLNWAALLHDVGKLDVPGEILTKISPLTVDEWALIKEHPAHGEAMVVQLRPWLGDWCDAVGDHHERWDGEGYPRGLSGTEISLGGRIVAVADTYDVLTSQRTYKEPSSPAEARAEIARCSGTQFDPEVVRAFMAVSIGRMRAAGPLSWLADAPLLAAIPLAPVAAVSAAAIAIGVTPDRQRRDDVPRSPGPVVAAIVAPAGVRAVDPRGGTSSTSISAAATASSAATRPSPAGESSGPAPVQPTADPTPPTGAGPVPDGPTEATPTPAPTPPQTAPPPDEVGVSVGVGESPPVTTTVPVEVPPVPVDPPVPLPDTPEVDPPTVTVSAGPVTVVVDPPKLP